MMFGSMDTGSTIQLVYPPLVLALFSAFALLPLAPGFTGLGFGIAQAHHILIGPPLLLAALAPCFQQQLSGAARVEYGK